MSENGKHDHPRSIDWWADEWGIDPLSLRRRIIDRFGETRRKFKAREAFDAFFRKSESEEARRRKNIAEAEASEIDTENKRRQFGYLTDFEFSMKDWSTRYRTTVEGAGYLPLEGRKRLIKQLLEVKPEPVATAYDK